jgi:hypothetical protein
MSISRLGIFRAGITSSLIGAVLLTHLAFAAPTPPWAPFSIAAGKVQSLNTPRSAVEFGFAAQHHCNFWIGVLANCSRQRRDRANIGRNSA